MLASFPELQLPEKGGDGPNIHSAPVTHFTTRATRVTTCSQSLVTSEQKLD